MATLSYPGVYMEEVSSGVRPIAAASTSTPAFVGLAEMGPIDEALRITNWTQFQKYYGTFINDSYLAYSVFQFFNNGGSQCYVLRVVPTGAVKANVSVENRAAVANSFTFTAKNEGAWGNYLYLQIEDGTDDPGNTFKLSIRKQEVVDVVPDDFLNIAPVEVHDNLGVDPAASNFVETVLASESSLIDGDFSVANNVTLQNGVHHGGYGAAVATPATGLKFQVNVNDDGFQEITLPVTLVNLTSVGDDDTTDVDAAIETAVQALAATKKKASTPDAAFTSFSCAVEADPNDAASFRLVLSSGTSSETSSLRVQNASTDNAAATLMLGEAFGGVSETGIARRRPANADAVQIGDAAVAAPINGVQLGLDGDPATLTEMSFSSQFPLLDKITDFSLLAVPGIGTTVMVDEGMNYCRNRQLQDVFYVGEMAETDNEPAEAESFRKQLTQPNSYGAVYYPWIKSLDPTGNSTEPISLPPSGFMAGLYARTDSKRGVWKAPAGTEATVSGAVGLVTNLTDVEQGNLNRINVNCLRRFASSGIVSWGARTVTSDAEWTYVPVRRMAIMLRVSIYNGIQWAVFEPNDEELWGQLRLNLKAFMMTLFRNGAFQGASPGDAFFVKCDSETTPQADIDLGIVNILVGFAPLKPAEFVVVKISQKAGQSS
jgi:Bacteriophage tail sheath protein